MNRTDSLINVNNRKVTPFSNIIFHTESIYLYIMTSFNKTPVNSISDYYTMWLLSFRHKVDIHGFTIT